MKITSCRMEYLHARMESAYDAQPFYALSRESGHMPLTAKNPRGGEVVTMAPHEASVQRADGIGEIQQPAERAVWWQQCEGSGL